jgi:hypothetical protein
MEKTKINGPNGPIEATELEFKVKAEPWTVIELEDGTTLRMRLNVGKVFRLEQFDQMTGEPQYVVSSKNDIATQVPSKLKKFLQFPKPTNQDVA